MKKNTYTLERNGGTLIAVLRGETTMNMIAALKAELLDAMRMETVQTVALDISQVCFMDTTGINFMVLMQNQCEAADKCFMLLRPSEQVAKVLDLVQLFDFFNIRQELEK